MILIKLYCSLHSLANCLTWGSYFSHFLNVVNNNQKQFGYILYIFMTKLGYFSKILSLICSDNPLVFFMWFVVCLDFPVTISGDAIQGYNGLVISMFVWHFQGWEFDSRLGLVYVEFAHSPRASGFPPPVQRYL